MSRSVCTSYVSIIDGVALDYSKQHIRIRELLDALDKPLSSLIRPGDKVFLKPDLRNPVNDSPESPHLSQPVVISAVIEILKDCGAIVSFGDEGSPNPWLGSPLPSRVWLHEIARRTNTKLVNFRASGGGLMHGMAFTPHRYLISRALLDTDAIIDLAHFHFHPKYVINGCVKNMFNAVLGDQQARFGRLFCNPKKIARRVVDVCEIVRPVLSIMDMTMYSFRSSREVPKNSGYLLASCDPVSVDTVAAAILGIDPQSIWTCRLGQDHGLGCSDIGHISIRGAYSSLPPNPELDIPRTSLPHNGYQKSLSRFINETILRPRPVIDPMACDQCGDCEQICPVDAIRRNGYDQFINSGRCVECLFCIDICKRGAIQRRFTAPVRFLRRIARRPLEVGTK